MKKVGLIVNPIAGMGGSVGLKGTDGEFIQEQCRKLGATPLSHIKALLALKKLKALQHDIEVVTCPGQMGANIVNQCGLPCQIIDIPIDSATTSLDTRKAAEAMRQASVDLLIFAGGDGTARDIYQAVGDSIVVLGIPAGVKIHSAAYAQNPDKAGELALSYLHNRTKRVTKAEVMDINEENYRKEILSAKLYGYLTVPLERKYMQSAKSGSPPSEKYSQEAIAHGIVKQMSDDFHYLIGPGTTTQGVGRRLKADLTLVGVDMVYRKDLIGRDLNESEILTMLKRKETKLILTPVGGQGFVLGRGNQQLSPKVIETVGKDNIIIIATPNKIHSLQGRPLLVDMGNESANKLLEGYYKIATGDDEFVVYKVTY